MINKFKFILDRKIRFALVGCGRVSANHINALKLSADNAELVAVCDINIDNLNKAVNETGAKPYSNLTKMLEEGGFDVVILATPSGLHPTQTIQCASYNYNVVTEKPMATKLLDGINMVKACDNACVQLFVVKQNRLNPTINLLKNTISFGKFGRIFNVSCNVFWTRPQEYYDLAKWRGTWEFDGGAFMNQASHYVDLLEWLIGPVESVQSYTATQLRDIEVEDSGVLALRWRNGALGTMNVSMLTYPKNLEGSITIIGENGTVRVGGVALNEIQIWQFADEDLDIIKAKESNYKIVSEYGLGHTLYYKNVIRALRGEEHPSTDGREGLKSLELLIAIYKSSRDGKKIALPLEY